MVILASSSPRRKELMKWIVPEFDIIPSNFDESSIHEPDPKKLVCILAQKKAQNVYERNAQKEQDIVIGCDTVVASPDNEVFGIPKDRQEAEKMLCSLSGRTHQVFSGVCILNAGRERVFYEQTEVSFREITPDELEWYLNTGESLDKAGAYGIQGYAGVFISGINGDYNNVVGLPVSKLWCILHYEMGMGF